MTAFEGTGVAEGRGGVGVAGVASAAQAVNKIQNTKLRIRFIMGSIVEKN
jgi:hypothetical protein